MDRKEQLLIAEKLLRKIADRGTYFSVDERTIFWQEENIEYKFWSQIFNRLSSNGLIDEFGAGFLINERGEKAIKVGLEIFLDNENTPVPPNDLSKPTTISTDLSLWVKTKNFFQNSNNVIGTIVGVLFIAGLISTQLETCQSKENRQSQNQPLPDSLKTETVPKVDSAVIPDSSQVKVK